MATLVFSAVGTALGGPVGGAIGSLVGRQVDTALFGGTRKGPRLRELDATSSTYGQVIARHYGTMRVGGTVIWATELVEHSETQGTGKGSPSLTSYSYSANFAVALSSRPIRAVGRIWADGKLLRGEDGLLKTAGELRIHTGHGDQPADPLLVAAESPAMCPAHRGLAYAVFEGLDLADFYNRIPSLTFEVLADDDFALRDILEDALQDLEADAHLEGIRGYTCEGPVLEALQAIDAVVPLDVDAASETLVIRREDLDREPRPLGEPTLPNDADGFGAQRGFVRHRRPPSSNPLALVRYYDRDRDYLPSVQRATGPVAPGTPGVLELPAALDSASAARLIHKASHRGDWSRDTISWRTSELDPAIAPGSLVTLPGETGHWRVCAWEWCEAGVEIELERAMPAATGNVSQVTGTAGRINPALDAQAGETVIVAFERPLDSAHGLADSPLPCVAVSSSAAGWSGAALYADRGDGEWHPLGPSGRQRATMGTAQNALAFASPHLLDRASVLIVTLLDPTMALSSASTSALADGANLALVGEELLQFAQATPLAEGTWRLEGLWRARAGTEAGLSTHLAGEPFVLLDASIRSLDAAILGTANSREIVAIGRGDSEPVRSPIRLDGLTRRPLAPVHPRLAWSTDGSMRLSWTRRARGAWHWVDGIDAPLVEESEGYLVTAGDPEHPIRSWTTQVPQVELDAAALAALAAGAEPVTLAVRQIGTHALSPILTLCSLP
ncbi:hypothetical protein HT136_05235 [Novosphingobium profundi]|uniref:phage tail protein n=1 Tax=Novosphingobium profundi TaxID=1774954 RepID=UPI001BD9911D|nr:phage tail protein [Novosphingobium profundi]MBT0667767.1 hypothetical protein [Novosphingobium profundi]